MKYKKPQGPAGGGTWEEEFSPSSADDMIAEFYTNHGWDETIYIPEVNIDGMVETPHEII
ncbi:MAG: hypothetical protein HRU26_02360, partial [Psychroserpens sp.]|nr:hypothetical protein [Psychroserpens sp.]